jgi:hypothetical protein
LTDLISKPKRTVGEAEESVFPSAADVLDCTLANPVIL